MASSTAIRYRNRQDLGSVAVADVLLRSALRPNALSDSLEMVDVSVQLRERNRTLLNSADVNDVAVMLRLRDRENNHLIEVTDSDSSYKYALRGITDVSEVTDTSTMLRERNCVTLDSITLQDAISLFEKVVLVDTLTVSDGFVTLRERNRTPSDDFDVNDFDEQLRERIRVLNDSLDSTDVVTANAIRSVYQVTLQDTLSLSDGFTAETFVILPQFDIEHGVEFLSIKHGIEPQFHIIVGILNDR